MLQDMPLPNLPGNVDNWQGSVDEKVDYWNFSQRVDVNFTDNVEGVRPLRAVQGQPLPAESDRQRRGFFPLSGSNRYGMSIAGDSVWVMSNKTTLNVRGSYYNMIDEFYNPSLLLGEDGLADYWPSKLVLVALQQRLRLLSRRSTSRRAPAPTPTTASAGRAASGTSTPTRGPLSARMNRYQGAHNMKWGGEMRAYYGEAARFEPINLVFNSALTANSSDSPQVATSGNQWATFLLGALDNQTSARLVPLQTTEPARLLGLLPGRLAGERPADAQPRPALGVRARRRPIRTIACRSGST